MKQIDGIPIALLDARYALVAHLHAGVYEPVDATIVRTGDVNWIDLTDGGATTLHTHAGGHVAVTLDANADTLLSLSTQELGLDTQTANRVFAGPTTGVAAVPTFRSLVAGDIPALSYGDISGTGIVGRVSEFVTNTKTLQAANLIAPANLLTLVAGAPYSLTIPATGTAALLGTANIFTANQTINCNSTTGLLVEQDGVNDNTLVVNTTNACVGINSVPKTTGRVTIKRTASNNICVYYDTQAANQQLNIFQIQDNNVDKWAWYKTTTHNLNWYSYNVGDVMSVAYLTGAVRLYISPTIGNGAAGTDYSLTFDGETNDGVITWMEDEDCFKFSDCLQTDNGRISKISTYTDTCNILVTDETAVFNKATDFTATMPTAVVGQVLVLKNIGAGHVTISFPGTDTVDEVDDDLILDQYDCVKLQCRLANKWIKIT